MGFGVEVYFLGLGMPVYCSRFRIQVLWAQGSRFFGLRVQGVGCMVQGLDKKTCFTVLNIPGTCLGFRVSGFGFWFLVFGFRFLVFVFLGFGFRVSNFGFRVPGSGFRVSGSEFRVSR